MAESAAATEESSVPGPAPAAPTTFTFTSSPSLAEFQQPLRAYLDANPDFDGIAVGACVFHHPPNPPSPSATTTPSPAAAAAAAAATTAEGEEKEQEPRILLVQRAPEDSMPRLWEVPGGASDLEDESLLHAVARELREETGLRARSVDALVAGSKAGDVFSTRAGRRMCKFSFLVEVEACDEVKLDPKEHTAYMWVTEEEARRQKCGDVEIKYTLPRQREVVFMAFELVKQRGRSSEK